MLGISLTNIIQINFVFLYGDAVSGDVVASIDLDEEDFVGVG